MEGNQRGQGCQRQEQVEQDGNDIPHHRYTAKGLLEHIRQGDEDERRTAVGIDTHRESGRKNHEACKDGNDRVDDSYLNS